MRLVRLSVERFQCIESTTVELGPGLNVLYGPNDLGKSSLAWAIRAALLLQHNSAAHARFVSWYGGGEPRVILTLQDDEERYWRVTKSFGGGTSGRSTLESSRNGQTYTNEASGRQVDDRLRALLRWGVHRPGGKGGPHGMPASFMTQVLLAEQEDVRKVLFDSSLARDEEESGRLRLAEALGALAQDPLFKRVLDEAQSQVDLAFTPTGKRKRGAGSPFVEISKHLEELQQQRDGLAEKLRETDLAEARIVQLNAARETTARHLEDARAALAGVDARLRVRQQRDALAGQIAAHRQRIADTETQQQQLNQRQTELARLEASLTDQVAKLDAAAAGAAIADATFERTRRELDELASGRTAADRAIDELGERQKAVLEADHDAKRAVDHAEAGLRKAAAIARAVRDAATSLEQASVLVGSTEDSSASAAAREEHVRAALEAGRQRLRDATSGDAARARELTRQQLQNQSLQLTSQRGELERLLERTAAIETLHARIDALRAEATRLAARAATSRDVVAQEQRAIERLEEEISIARQLEQYGRLREATTALQAAQASASAADRELARAAELRLEAAGLRTRLPAYLPTAESIERLRRLHHDVEVAQARLGAVSVVVKPRRPLAVQIAQDGATGALRTITEPISISGEREVSLSIEDVVDIEITGGDATTRADVASLKERWHREGTPALQAAGVETLEQLTTLRASADRWLVEAASRDRDAATAEALAAGQRPTNLEQLQRARSEREAELHAPDLVDLGRRFEALGAAWSQTLKRRIDDTQRKQGEQRARLDQRATQAAREDAQLETHRRDLADRERELAAQAAALAEPWTELAARSRSELVRIDGERSRIERALEDLVGVGSGEESKARSAIATAETALEAARKQREQAGIEAQRARDNLIAARTRFDDARREGLALDTTGAWTAALADALPELSTATWQAALVAATEARDRSQREVADIRHRLEELTRGRGTAIDAARGHAARAQQQLAALRDELEQRREQERRDRERLASAQREIAELRVQLAASDVERSRSTTAELQHQLDALPDPGPVDASHAANHAQAVDQLARELRDVEDELQKSRGALQHVGGTIVRDQIRDLDQAIQQHRERQREIEIEYDAWQLLVEILRVSESGQTQHLGRQLAAPVSRRFHQLTGGRYGGVELSTHLEAEGLHAGGELRQISTLSTGTQDQLATLLRLCIAEQLRSAIVLDDHLRQSDAERLAWFNTALRSAAPQLQVVFITCRPEDILVASERPSGGEAVRVTAAGLLRAIDLSQIIRRYPASATLPSSPSVVGARLHDGAADPGAGSERRP